MKVRNLLIILFFMVVLLVYNMFCYYFVNKTIDNGSKYEIQSYLANIYGENVHYKYKSAMYNEDNTVSVYVKVDSDYYQFVMIKNGNLYFISRVNQDIPVYIK